MFISKLEAERKSVLITGISELIAAFFCWIFSAIYIACGHGKTSGFMVCLLLPFFLSGMAMLLLSFTDFYKVMTFAFRCLWNLSAASFTIGMALVGIFEIAGVPNSIFLVPIWIGGAATALCGVAVLIYNKKKTAEEL